MLDAQEQPLAGVPMVLAWPDGQSIAYTDAEGKANQPLYASFDPAHEAGPYSVWVSPPSDVVAGLGLPLNRHVAYELTYRRLQ